MEARAAEQGVALRVTGESVSALLDRGTIQMALCNLLANAIDASEAGNEVCVELGATEECVSISVVDLGEGMTEEQRSNAGTPFKTSKPGGTGLGLAIARQIAGAHGGSLNIESAVGKGTTATLTIPRDSWQTS